MWGSDIAHENYQRANRKPKILKFKPSAFADQNQIQMQLLNRTIMKNLIQKTGTY